MGTTLSAGGWRPTSVAARLLGVLSVILVAAGLSGCGATFGIG